MFDTLQLIINQILDTTPGKCNPTLSDLNNSKSVHQHNTQKQISDKEKGCNTNLIENERSGKHPRRKIATFNVHPVCRGNCGCNSVQEQLQFECIIWISFIHCIHVKYQPDYIRTCEDIHQWKKYPIEHCYGSVRKYTTYSLMTNITKESEQALPEDVLFDTTKGDSNGDYCRLFYGKLPT